MGKEKAYERLLFKTQILASRYDDRGSDRFLRKKCPPVIEGAKEGIINDPTTRAKEYTAIRFLKSCRNVLIRNCSITTYGFSVMYRIAQELVRHSLADGYLVGSRGSVGSSLVAYLSDIPEVNSLQGHYICPNGKT